VLSAVCRPRNDIATTASTVIIFKVDCCLKTAAALVILSVVALYLP